MEHHESLSSGPQTGKTQVYQPLLRDTQETAAELQTSFQSAKLLNCQRFRVYYKFNCNYSRTTGMSHFTFSTEAHLSF